MRSRLEPMKKVARTIRIASAVDPELVPGPGRGLVGGRGGAQQQGETGDEKVVRIPDARRWRNWLSYTTSVVFPSRNAPTDSAEEALNELTHPSRLTLVLQIITVARRSAHQAPELATRRFCSFFRFVRGSPTRTSNS